MAGNRSKEAATEEVEMQMTPMIDVTFLLLIFFLCSIKFKLLDGKLAAYLPRDVGVNATPIDVELLKIDIRMEVSKSTSDGFLVTVNDEKKNFPQEFYRSVKSLHERAPELKATIYPGTDIEYGHVVKVVNECLRANLTEITFGGTVLDE
jgi:biopolymer transport protein ExbD